MKCDLDYERQCVNEDLFKFIPCQIHVNFTKIVLTRCGTCDQVLFIDAPTYWKLEEELIVRCAASRSALSRSR